MTVMGESRKGPALCLFVLWNIRLNTVAALISALQTSAPPPRFQTDPVHDIVLFHRPAGLNPVTLKVPGVAAGQLLVTTGQNMPALPGPVPFQNNQADIAIEIGIYKATVVGTGQSKLFEVPNDRIVML